MNHEFIRSGERGWRSRGSFSAIIFSSRREGFLTVHPLRLLALFADSSFACAALCLASAALCRHVSAHDALPPVRCIAGTRLVCPVFALYAHCVSPCTKLSAVRLKLWPLRDAILPRRPCAPRLPSNLRSFEIPAWPRPSRRSGVFATASPPAKKTTALLATA